MNVSNIRRKQNFKPDNLCYDAVELAMVLMDGAMQKLKPLFFRARRN
jgi:hypothetical protein